MTLFDSHAHFDADAVEHNAALVNRAIHSGLVGVLAVGGDDNLNAGALNLATQFPHFVYPTLGFTCDEAKHLDNAHHSVESYIERLQNRIQLQQKEELVVRGIGEIGLDFSRHPSETEKLAQMTLFKAQLELANLLQLPCCIHTRDADAETLEALDATSPTTRHPNGSRGVIHCFTGSLDFANQLLERGFYLSISGIVTFANADALRKVTTFIPSNRLLIETDSPYLAPVPYRGKTNEPAFIEKTLLRLALTRNEDPTTLAQITTQNAYHLFNLPTESPSH